MEKPSGVPTRMLPARNGRKILPQLQNRKENSLKKKKGSGEFLVLAKKGAIARRNQVGPVGGGGGEVGYAARFERKGVQAGGKAKKEKLPLKNEGHGLIFLLSSW